jgi:hypothetical protein
MFVSVSAVSATLLPTTAPTRNGDANNEVRCTASNEVAEGA